MVARNASPEELKAYQHARYMANREDRLAKNKAYREKNLEACRAMGKRWREENKEHCAAKARGYVEGNKERVRERQAAWYAAKRAAEGFGPRPPAMTPEEYKVHRRAKLAANKEHVNALRRDRWARNPDVRRKAKEGNEKWNLENLQRKRALDNKKARTYRQKYPEKIKANGHWRRAAELQATPAWLTRLMKREIVAICKRSQETGMNVDHIIPLRGKNVCGLHVPWNLQLLAPFKNRAKKNNLTRVQMRAEHLRLFNRALTTTALIA